MTNNTVFKLALEKLERQFPPSSLSAWFDDVTVVSFSDGKLILHSPVPFKKEFIDNKFIGPLQTTLQELTNENITVSIVTGDYMEPGANVSPYEEYTFERFIVGSSNKFAHAAAIAVAYNPAQTYNPLFIYGQSGLGKTHLLYSIANVIRETRPEYQIIYVKGEDFTNELITAIQMGKVQDFRAKYRMADLLLIDDVQFIAGKERTQEEFFHTFNALYESQRQIVLTSDRPPKEISTLEERMKTRFEWGLLADIQPPDFETRVAIIRDKSIKAGLLLPDEVAVYIAENIQANIRQIEGAIKKIKAQHELVNEQISIKLAGESIAALQLEAQDSQLTPESIMEVVANYFCISVAQMLSSTRSKSITYPRQLAMYLIREKLGFSFPDIAKIFQRDHTTVIHAYYKIEEDCKKKQEINDIIEKISNNFDHILHNAQLNF